MISIYCSPTHIKIIDGKSDNSNITVNNCFSSLIPDGAMINGIITDEELMTKTLSELNNEYGFARDEAHLVIESNSILVKAMDVPPVSPAQVLEFVQREFSQYDEGAADVEMIYDYTVINPKSASGGSTILAVGASKELLETYRNVFTEANYDLESINVGINTQIKLARFLPALQEGTYILAAVDGKVLTFTLFHDGEYDLSNKYRLLNADSTDEWYSELGDNLSSMIQFNKGQKEHSEIKTVYFAGISNEDVSHLNNNFSYLGVDIKALSFEDKLIVSDVTKSKGNFDPGNYLYNIGNLLRK